MTGSPHEVYFIITHVVILLMTKPLLLVKGHRGLVGAVASPQRS